MKSKKHEEVRKRRAKASTSPPNQYQKIALVAGALTLFGAIGTGGQLAPFLAGGGLGGMPALFLAFKARRTRREAEGKGEPPQALPAEEESGQPQPIPPEAEGKIIDDSPDFISEQIDSEGLQESMPPEPGEAVMPPHSSPVQKEDLSHIQEFSREGVLAPIQERLAMVEERVSRLEHRGMDLEEKAASNQAGQMKSDPQIDLQTILAHLDEKEGKVTWPSKKS